MCDYTVPNLVLMGKRRSYQLNIARYTAPGAGSMPAKKTSLLMVRVVGKRMQTLGS